MAGCSGSLVKVLNVKVDLVKSQTKELQACLETFIDKIQSDVIALSTEDVPTNHVSKINSRLDASLALLMGKWPQINAEIQAVQTQILKIEEDLKTVAIEKLISEKEHNSRFEFLDNRVKVLEEDDRLSSLQKQLQKTLEDDSNIKEHETRLNAVEDLIQKLEVSCSEMDKIAQKHTDEVQTLFESLDNRVKVLEEDDRLSSLQKQLQKTLEDDSDIKEHEKRLNAVEDLIQKLEVSCSEMDKIAQKHTDEVQTLKKSVSDVNHRQNKLENTSDTMTDLQSYLSGRVETAMDRLAMSKAEGKHEMDEFVKKLNNLDSLFNQVCRMVSTKVDPLCRLQAILNKHQATLKTRNTTAAQMKTVNLKVNRLSRTVQKLELDSEKMFIGFTAYFHNHVKVTKGSTLKFTDVRYNKGNCYYPGSGKFTAARDGIYMAAVTLSQSSAGAVCVHIIQAAPRTAGRVVCKAQTEGNYLNSCGIGIASLKAGDEIYVMVKDVMDDAYLSGFSSFSCILIADK